MVKWPPACTPGTACMVSWKLATSRLLVMSAYVLSAVVWAAWLLLMSRFRQRGL